MTDKTIELYSNGSDWALLFVNGELYYDFHSPVPTDIWLQILEQEGFTTKYIRCTNLDTILKKYNASHHSKKK